MNLLKRFAAAPLKTPLLCAALFIAGTAPFLPALRGGFVGLDDTLYITENAKVQRPLTLSGVKEIFTTKDLNLYSSVTTLSFALEHSVYGNNPLGYHIDNILLHGLNAVLVFLLFSIFGGQTAGFVTALLFAVHPQRPESVAWLAERKDVLFSFFMLGSFILYLKWRDTQSRRVYVGSVFLFLLSLLAKPMAVTLPVLMLCSDWYQGRKFSLADKLPFFALAGAAGLLAVIWGDAVPKELLSVSHYGLAHRVTVMFNSVWFYVGKTFAPVALSPRYPFADGTGLSFPMELVPGAVAGGALCAAGVWFAKKSRLFAFSFAGYLLMLLPVSGIVLFNDTPVADRYSYMTQPWLLFFVAAALARWAERTPWVTPARRRLGVMALGGLVLFFAISSAARCNYWNNPVTFWTEIILYFPKDATALNARGHEYLKLGLVREALADFNAAITYAPDSADAYHNRGVVSLLSGDAEGALQDCAAALRLNPTLTSARLVRARIYERSQRPLEALDELMSGVYYQSAEDKRKQRLILGELEKQFATGKYSGHCLYDKLVFVMQRNGMREQAGRYLSKMDSCVINVAEQNLK